MSSAGAAPTAQARWIREAVDLVQETLGADKRGAFFRIGQPMAVTPTGNPEASAAAMRHEVEEKAAALDSYATLLRVRETAEPAAPHAADSKKEVFVVHGRDDGAKETVARFLERLGLEAIILHEETNKGRTIIEKFEAHADRAGYAVVLLTPDDVGALRGAEPTPRARQNVIFELGYFFGKLGRENVCALLVDGLERPSDVDGVVYVAMDSGATWRLKLAMELRDALPSGTIDLNRL